MVFMVSVILNHMVNNKWWKRIMVNVANITEHEIVDSDANDDRLKQE